MKLPQPFVEASDGSTIGYVEARKLWESGEFSEWADGHCDDAGNTDIAVNGFRSGEVYSIAEAEDALSDDQWDNEGD